MMRAIRKSREVHRKLVESTYEGRATVTEHKKVTDSKTKQTSYREVITLKNQPCKISFEKIEAAGNDGPVVSKNQIIKLFISPDIVIRPGSKITVEQNGVTEEYTHSGKSAIFATHQEIILELFERRA